jgi:membrane protein YqaA with SNARE-associated domain
VPAHSSMSSDTISPHPSTAWGRARAWVARMYARVESYANTPAAFSALIVVSAIDSAFFPVPPFVLLIPMIIAAPHRWLPLTLWGTVASVAGSLLGYGIGAAMRGGLNLIHVDPNVRLDLGPDWLRKVLLVLALLAAAVAVLSALQGLRQRFAARQRASVAGVLAALLFIGSQWTGWFQVHGTLAELLSHNWWSLAVVCMVVPAFKLATIGSGLVGVSLLPFLGAVVIARLVRFGVAAALARFGGPPVRDWLLKHHHTHAAAAAPAHPLET